MKFYLIFVIMMMHSGLALAQKLKVITHEFPPFSYIDENNQLTGMSVEILHAVFNDMKFSEYDIDIQPWKRALKMARSNPNHLLFPFARKDNREADFEWVGKAGPRKISLFKLKSRQDIKENRHIDTYKQYLVSSLRGTAYTHALDELEFTSTANTTTPLQSILMLYKGRVDLVLDDDAVFYHSIKNYGQSNSQITTDKIQRVVQFSEPSDRWFGFGKGSDEQLVKEFKNSYDKLAKKGVIAGITKQYFE